MTSGRDPSPADYWALAELRYQIRRFLHRRERAARAEGVSGQQYQLLLETEGRKARTPPTVGALAERLHIRHHSAVGLVDRLVRRGLVRRRRAADDRRRVLVELSATGRATLRRVARYSLSELRKEGPELVAVLRRLMRAGRALRP
jgi:DNA-binding MarR family transcriptional regulator